MKTFLQSLEQSIQSRSKVWVKSMSVCVCACACACKTSLGQMISVQFCHKSLNGWLGGKGCGATVLQYFKPLVNFKGFIRREDESYKKI